MRSISLLFLVICSCETGQPGAGDFADLAAPDPCVDFPEGHSCCLGATHERGGCQAGLVCFYTGPGIGAECVRPCGADAGSCGAGVACRVHLGGMGNSGCFCELASDAEDRSDGGVCR